MNRKRWIVAGVIFVILLVIGIIVLSSRRQGDTVRTVRDVPVLELAYCFEESAKPCVVSFSTDANDNMLVNILLPDMAFPIFYLKIDHGEGESLYNCQRVRQANVIAYCSGKKLPPGQVLHLTLISTRDSIVLAEGDLSIIGLEFPTQAVVSQTPEITITSSPTQLPTLTQTATVSPTASTTPTRTPRVFPTPTKMTPSYPNPSYP